RGGCPKRSNLGAKRSRSSGYGEHLQRRVGRFGQSQRACRIASHPLSRAADAQLRQQAQQSLGAVIVSWWRHPASVQSTGTETAWLADLPGAWVEVYCRCRPSIAVDRFLARRRHPGHLDRDKTRAAEQLRFEQLHALGPLGLGRLITVDTERPVDLPALLRRLG
ncbi:MAG: hypothetical protein ACK5VO_08395, partial [Betaproteobacteria bacterium]